MSEKNSMSENTFLLRNKSDLAQLFQSNVTLKRNSRSSFSLFVPNVREFIKQGTDEPSEMNYRQYIFEVRQDGSLFLVFENKVQMAPEVSDFSPGIRFTSDKIVRQSNIRKS